MFRASIKTIYKRYFQRLFFAFISILFFLPQQSQAQCTSVSIYDRIVSGYHSTLAVKTDGKIAVWGEDMRFGGVNSAQTTPWDLSAPVSVSNPAIMGTVGGGLQGGADQAIFLVSDGLYALGNYGGVLSTLFTSSTNFQKILTPTGGDASTKLPNGIAVNDVANIFATYKTLLIVTKNDGGNANRNGQVWIITQTSQAVEANGGSANTAGSSSWKRVHSAASIPLTNIIASRGQISPIPSSSQFNSAFMALAANGDVYTWGNSTYLGDNSSVTSKLYATKMTLPSEFSSSNVPKMIGVTGGTKNVINPFPAAASYAKNSYYLLSNSGSLYALGDNSKYQCGDFTKTERSNWVKVQKSATAGDYFTDINFISVQEHTAGIPCASAITTDGKLYTWGEDDAGMLGKGTGSIASYDPGVQSYSPGIANGSAGTTALFCEMGGHTLMYLNVGSDRFCYVGHKTRGSMGDGTINDNYITSFDCTNTPQISICGSVPVAPVTNSSVVTASPTSIVANGTSTSTITVQLKNSSNINLTTTGGVGVITTSLGTISSTVDNNDGTYTAILTSPISSGTATLGFNLSGITSSSTATVEFTPMVAPLTPGSINGLASSCPTTAGLTYSVSPVANAESYNWTVPTGWTITAGQGTYSITVTAGSPGQNGNISVSAINRIRTSGLSTLAVTVRPVFTSGEIISTGETICYAGTPTLIGSTTASSGGNGVITYSWRSSADGYVAVISSATVATYTPPAGLTSTTSYRRYANDGICNTTATVSAGTWTVTVLPIFITGTISSTGETICNGGTPTTTIGNTIPSSGGNGSITYSWRSSADGYVSSIPSANTATYKPPAGLTTTTSYRRYANDGLCNTLATVSTGTWTVTVRPVFSSGEISSTGETICYVGNPTITIGNTVASSGGNGSITYSWRSSADGFVAAIPSATATTYTPSSVLTSTTSYRRYANDGLCNTSATVSTGTWTVNVLPAFITGTISSTGETVCNGGTPTITIGSTTASSGGNGSISYSWRSSADGYVSSIPSANTATYTPPAGLTSTTSYRRYANDGKCNTTATVSAGTWIVSFEVLLENKITLFSNATTDSQSICIGNNITTIEYTTVGATGFTITGLPTGLQAVFQSNKIKITGTPSVTGVFNYTISLVGGCGQVNKTGTVIINSLPTGTIAASNNGVICEGSNVVLTATGGNTYEWNLNGNSIAGALAANYSASVAGLYTVKLISDKGCINFVQQTATLVLNNAPVVGFSFDKYCINTPIIFTNSSSTDLSGPVTMLWDFGDNETSSSTSPTHSFLVEKTFSVKLTVTPTNCPLIAKSLSKNIKIELPPSAVRYPKVYAVKNTNTKLTARAIGKTYAWSPITGLSNSSAISPNFNFTTATNYVIKITNDAGCIFNDSLNVLIFDKADFFVPNAFSPNNDGRNDKLKIAAPGIESFQYFRIFNRWGNLVFETSNSSIFWDGTFKGMAQPAEVYSWFAEGISESGNKIQRNGQTLILR